MSENIAISDLKNLAKKHGYDHVICFATKGKMEFVATYGVTVEQCDQAAQFGDKLKDGLGWPESLHAMPSRVKQLKVRAEKAEKEASELRDAIVGAGFIVGVDKFGSPALGIAGIAQKGVEK